jgi:hypothetical protein
VIAACHIPKTALELVKVLFRRALDGHQMGFALGEALAHLNFLVHQRVLDRILENDGVDRFIRTGG